MTPPQLAPWTPDPYCGQAHSSGGQPVRIHWPWDPSPISDSTTSQRAGPWVSLLEFHRVKYCQEFGLEFLPLCSMEAGCPQPLEVLSVTEQVGALNMTTDISLPPSPQSAGTQTPTCGQTLAAS